MNVHMQEQSEGCHKYIRFKATAKSFWTNVILQSEQQVLFVPLGDGGKIDVGLGKVTSLLAAQHPASQNLAHQVVIACNNSSV